MKYKMDKTFWKYISLTVIGASSGWIYHQVKQTRDILENTVDTKVLKFKSVQIEDDSKEENFINLLKSDSIDNYNMFRSTWDSLKFSYARRLVRLANSDHKEFKTKAIRDLAKLKNLDSWHCSLLANMINAKTAVALARSGDADKRLFMEPPLRYHNYNRTMLINATRELLISLYEHSNHPCLSYFLRKVFVYEHDNTHIVDHDSSSLELSKFIQSEIDVLPKCLESLIHHCSVEKYSKDLAYFNGLPLLMEIYHRYQDNLDITIKICQILSYMSVNKDLLEAIHKSGWIGILSEWVNHSDVKVSVPAARALANLDSGNEFTFPRRIYLLHPLLKTTGNFKMDVVFVHGLLGGVFYTWRQRKYKNNEKKWTPKDFDENLAVSTSNQLGELWTELKSQIENDTHKQYEIVLEDIPTNGNELSKGPFSIPSNSYDENISKLYTQCWPKDWLSQDIDNIRIIGINYGTSLSMWAPICPLVKAKFSLEERSSDLLDKLIEAGVGTRPIVWVTHSMGGLIVKNMLLKAHESDNQIIKKVCSNTKAIIFYSTPHNGSRLANLSSATALLLWPSVEVQELRENSPQLKNLHEKFLNILKEVPMKIVTFVETKSTVVTAMKLNFRLVEPKSGNPGIGEYFEVPQDHLGICKPVAKYSFLYQKVVHTLKEILNEDARNKISKT